MAKRKTKQAEELPVVTVDEVHGTGKNGLSSVWNTLKDRQDIFLYVLGGIALVILGYWGYKVLVVEPQQKDAVNAMWQAQRAFERDSFRLALENPGGGYDGFLGIIDKYGSTKAANLAKYYAGICYLNLGELDNAIKYLEDFDAEGDILPILKYGVLGDAYSEKQNYEKAAKMYEKASNSGNHPQLAAHYLKKLGLLHEYRGNKEAAIAAYERLRRDFADQQVAEWRDIEKYIYRAGGGSQ
ncbi:MAG: tetratricopeptide repeat protein [Saprospiraceae bacterium]|nr:tetratricopeptide repeat protein [Saprospiraceae bacterium]MDW8484198.1 tetratricopeptide repeat protein [Saprospiraceae bacterium]